ncbi:MULTISPECIES: cell division protein FtsQ/DivIB [Pseudomonas]|jgi:cell division protein FtsQ|uniref:cell division protein FtsQ/DivIB n=1 Tax=Pseudomonas TaxID=286 RepID=UPI0005663C3F|nr:MULTISPECIES: cell division protein FtsQ/DivIB [Pseudomonas]MCB1655367.1 cell division protein FtsQ/DivIB [Pseudomonadales bacterium]NBF15667.1 FtsQ-type POTRA domain-containing protein [Pseudomonas sp. Fl4BN2]NNG60518.1 cell division protein FtsQ/DivIB [Pseudomonas sp. GC01]AUB74040.1 cell division protein FtsQ [Pseudomonas sp. Lz4W]MCH4867762.1 cell division protein FtsQ/DivIB [Pseudomonas sp. TMW22089]
MQGASLRHQQPVPGRKPVPRGASRMVAKEPMSVRLPKANFGFLKVLFWPVLLVVLGYGTYEGAQRLMPYADRPITNINVQGDLTYISQQAVQQRIAPYMAASFFTVDLEGMRTELEQMPWIAHAEVRRVWPDQVVIRLEEQLPVARWGDEALLNNQGQAFTPRELANYEHLPQLFGPQRAQQQVMQQYQVLSQMLRPMGFSIARLELRERGSWFLTTGAGSAGPGIELLLGRDHLVEKMRRFIAIYEKTLKEQITNIARIDLRYANGLAVGWREPVAPTIAQPAVAKN